ELTHGQEGPRLSAREVTNKARDIAQKLGDSRVEVKHLAIAILESAGYEVVGEDCSLTPEEIERRFNALFEEGESASDSFKVQILPSGDGPAEKLEEFGRNLTRQARQGKLGSIVGREEEIQLVIETLCRRTKRNPVLVGPAGVGKTAIVEGLAQRVIRGEVPDLLKGVQIYEIQPTALVAGTRYYGVLEERVEILIREASRDDVILFIDELHSIVGAGGPTGRNDVASLLKPALARGDLACIAATTDEEYRRYIEPDPALERRFQPIRVQELTPEQTLGVLSSLRDELARQRGVRVPDDVLRWLISFAQQFMRNRYFPDKAVDLLEQSVAHAVVQGKDTLDMETAMAVARRVVGMPLDVGERLRSLKARLTESALLSEGDCEALLNRLSVTMRGLDLRPSRPNAVILLVKNAADESERLAEILAEALNGSPHRVIAVDFSRFQHPADLAVLAGAPSGYGYDDTAGMLHRLLQIPHCVLRFENIHASHPAVREALAAMLAEGSLVDARGRRIYLSDTIVLLTAELSPPETQIYGFRMPEQESGPDFRRLAAELGNDLVAQVDLVCAGVPGAAAARRQWLCKNFLDHLSLRVKEFGVDLRFHESVLDWLLSFKCEKRRDWEKLIDEEICTPLAGYLAEAGPIGTKKLVMKYDGSSVIIEIWGRGRKDEIVISTSSKS
ncbi:MAG: AAA family ATPase, partial [Firmicutes bacterium]|nr:AAA family ATPase [Bacillota bacterium]